MTPLAIHYAVAERWPLVTTGGLGEVAYAFPRALAARGHRVSVLLPGYADLVATLADGLPATPVPELPGYAWREAEIDGLRHLILVGPGLSDRPGGPYQDDRGRPWPDLVRRFGLFSRACAERARADRADILHLNDWHTALAAVWLKGGKGPRTVLTVHNFRYRGETSPEELAALLGPLGPGSLPGEHPPTLLGAGLAAAHAVQTVSPGYAREVLGSGDALGAFLRGRSGGLPGILNGLDTVRWNPRTDPHLPHRYGLGNTEIKRRLREELLARWGFGTDAPLAVFIGRLVPDKGVDLLLALLPELSALGINLAVLGRGDPHYEAILRDLRDGQGRCRTRLAFDDAEAHRLLAAADLLLMPSRYEPCGLVQLEALRYGAVPVVHAAGGLRDTVRDVRRDPAGNGFVFAEPTPEAFIETVHAARGLLADEGAWTALVRRGMSENHGWSRRIPAYERLYRRALRA